MEHYLAQKTGKVRWKGAENLGFLWMYCGYGCGGRGHAGCTGDGGQRRGGRTVRVETAAVSKGTVERILALSGRVRYETEYGALAPATGIVAEVYVQPGQRVTAGQALFRMDGTGAGSGGVRLPGAGRKCIRGAASGNERYRGSSCNLPRRKT